MAIPSRNVQRQLDDLRREHDALRAKVAALYAQRDARANPPRDVRLARATTGGYFPADTANTFEIVFLDGSFTPTAGTQSVTWIERSAEPQAIARSLVGSISNDAVLIVLFANRLWWIIGFAGELIRFKLTENMGASVAKQASATQYSLSGTSLSVSITVEDPINAFAELENGDDGYALRQGGRLIVIQAPCPA